MATKVVRFENFEVDLDRREVRRDGMRIGLQQKPFRVLELLLRRPGQLVSRQELIRYLWPDSHVGFSHGLNTAVNSLRHALSGSPHSSELIETRPGLGYCFTAAVEEVQEKDPTTAEEFGAIAHQPTSADCLRGQHLLDRMTADDTCRAIAFFKSALEDQRSTALAFAGLAEAYSQLGVLGSMDPTLEREARAAATAALRLNPELPEAHAAQGRVKLVFDWNCQAAEAAAVRAIALGPQSVASHLLYAATLQATGRSQEAQHAYRTALGHDPLSCRSAIGFAACCYATGEYNRAVEQCWTVLALAYQCAPAQLILALAYEQLGLREEALDEFCNAANVTEYQLPALAGKGHLLATANHDHKDELDEVHRALATLAGASGFHYAQALLCVARQQNEAAFTHLAASAKQREPALLWATSDARLRVLRSDPQFDLLLEDAGFSAREKQRETGCYFASPG